MEIQKVRKSGEQKIITIPKNSEMKLGDFVRINKIVEDENLSLQSSTPELNQDVIPS